MLVLHHKAQLLLTRWLLHNTSNKPRTLTELNLRSNQFLFFRDQTDLDPVPLRHSSLNTKPNLNRLKQPKQTNQTNQVQTNYEHNNNI